MLPKPNLPLFAASALLFFGACQAEEQTHEDLPANNPQAHLPIGGETHQTAFQDSDTEAAEMASKEVIDETLADVAAEGELARAYFASGCFWCVEAIYESVRGVSESISGYSGGHTQNPTYDSSNTGKTGHAEAVEIQYDPAVVSFASLVDVYFGSQDITQKNGQGPDRGSQYRSIIFYQNETQKQIIDAKIAELNRDLDGQTVAAEVMAFEKFWVGEDYHQNFERLHPQHRYIVGVSVPRLRRFQAKFPELLKPSDH